MDGSSDWFAVACTAIAGFGRALWSRRQETPSVHESAHAVVCFCESELRELLDTQNRVAWWQKLVVV